MLLVRIYRVGEAQGGGFAETLVDSASTDCCPGRRGQWLSGPPVCSSTITNLDILRDEVEALNTSIRTINALNKILDRAQSAFDDGNNKTTRSNLDNFIQQVVRRSNSKETDSNRIPLDEANGLLCAAANVLIGIPLP